MNRHYLFQLTRREPIDWDELSSVIVSARNSEDARTQASIACGDEGAAKWFSPKSVEVKCIGKVMGEPRPVYMREVRYG